MVLGSDDGGMSSDATQTIELTAKQLKKQYLIGALICALGFSLFFYAFSGQPGKLSVMAWVGGIVGLIGAVRVFSVKVRMWWSHG